MPKLFGRDGQALRLVATLRSWARVDEVAGVGGLSTDEVVLKRVLHDPEYVPGGPRIALPRPEAICRVRYKACVAREGRASGVSELGEMIEVTQGAPGIEGAVAADSPVHEFKQGERLVPPCLDAAVLGMKNGERALLSSPAVFAYGATAFPPAEKLEPAHRACAVEILVELIDFLQPPDTNGVPVAKLMPLHVARKEAGTRLYGIGALREAVAKWELAEATLPHGTSLKYDLARGDRPEEEVTQLRAQVEKVQLACQLNLATAYLRLDEPMKAVANAERALILNPDSVKALFKRGQARMRIRPVDVVAAREDLLEAARLDPQNREIRAELEKLKGVYRAHKRKEVGIFGNMFDRANNSEPEPSDKPPQPSLASRAPGDLFGDVKLAETGFGSRDDP